MTCNCKEKNAFKSQRYMRNYREIDQHLKDFYFFNLLFVPQDVSAKLNLDRRVAKFNQPFDMPSITLVSELYIHYCFKFYNITFLIYYLFIVLLVFNQHLLLLMQFVQKTGLKCQFQTYY